MSTDFFNPISVPLQSKISKTGRPLGITTVVQIAGFPKVHTTCTPAPIPTPDQKVQTWSSRQTTFLFYFGEEREKRPYQSCPNLQKLPAVFLHPLLPQRPIIRQTCRLRGPGKMRRLAAKPLIPRTIATTTTTTETRVEAVEGARRDEVDAADGEVEEDVEIRGLLPAKACASFSFFLSFLVTHD